MVIKDERDRECLRCGKTFKSESIGNRICRLCALHKISGIKDVGQDRHRKGKGRHESS
jgi:hypothetical protein